MLSVAEIKRLIDEDISSERKRQALVGQRYYDAKHDILQTRFFYFNDDGNLVEDTYRANTRIAHPFFMELADQIAPYMLSSDENPIRAKKGVEGLQEHFDEYFDADFWAEIEDLVTGAYVKGFDYLYATKNAENRLCFKCADGMGVVEVREKDTDERCEYKIYWYIDRVDKGKKAIKRIQVWSAKEVAFFMQSGNGKIVPDDNVEINPRPHVIFTDKESGKKKGASFGYIPFWRMDNNKKQLSGVHPIKGLIDDYDLHACSLSNNLVDFDTPLYAVKGYDGNDLNELQHNLKTKKIVGVGEDGGIDVATVDIPFQARKEKLNIDRENIYQFGYGLNTSGLKDTAATTNIAIKSAYTLLDIKANKLQKRLCKVLKEVVKVVLDEINKVHGKAYQMSDVEFVFTPNVPTNESENTQIDMMKAQIKQIEINTILNIAMNIGDDQALKAICEVMDYDYEELKSRLDALNEEQNLADAQELLSGLETEEEGDTEDDGISEGERETQNTVLAMLDDLLKELE